VIEYSSHIYTLSEIRDIIIPIAQSHGVDKVYLFGSYARGIATEKSDIDLWIERGKVRTLFALGGLYVSYHAI
jgi:predicted nucleotidyltransferase